MIMTHHEVILKILKNNFVSLGFFVTVVTGSNVGNAENGGELVDFGVNGQPRLEKNRCSFFKKKVAVGSHIAGDRSCIVL